MPFVSFSPTASPRPRRGKKIAPLPPAIPDRPYLTATTDLIASNDPIEPPIVNIIPAVNSIPETKPSIPETKPSLPDKPLTPDNKPLTLENKVDVKPVVAENKPAIPEKPDSPDKWNSLERPSMPPPPRPVSPAPSPNPFDKPISPRLDRPTEPPPPRPVTEKPSRPERSTSQELAARRDTDDIPAKPPRPSMPPPPPRRGHGTRAEHASDDSLNIDMAPAPPERSESKCLPSEPAELTHL